MTPKTGLLGGAFNPPHYGHLRPAQEAMQLLGLERVVLIPSGVHPFKGVEQLVPVHHRLAMVRLAVQEWPEFDVWEIEAKQAGTAYTVETLAAWHQQFPAREPVLLVGADILFELHLWKGWQRIIELAHLCVLTRPGFTTSGVTAPAMEWLQRFQVTCAGELDRGRLGHYGFCVQPVTLLELSSSAMRRNLQAGASVNAQTPDAVIDYIRTHDLYGTGRVVNPL